MALHVLKICVLCFAEACLAGGREVACEGEYSAFEKWSTDGVLDPVPDYTFSPP